MNNGHSSLREFGKCRLDIEKKFLLADQRPVQLPLKALELLCVLVEKRGDVVTKDEIWQQVWPDAFVEETNLTHTIYLLRKAFKDIGEGSLIETVPRRGYRFAGDVQEIPDPELVLERHARTSTLIEIEESERAGPAASTAASRSQSHPSRVVLFSGVALIMVLAAGFAIINLRNDKGSSSGIKSLAVLPFKSLSGEADNDHQGLGLADILITRLGILKELNVRPTSSVSAFEKQTIDWQAIGQALNVDAVLEGTIYRGENDVRVTVRLLRVDDGKTIWTGQFEKPSVEELRLQDEISLRVAESLVQSLDPAEKKTLTKRYTENRDAYEAYLRGRFFFDKRDPQIYPTAINEYQRAIDIDPNYALAYSGLADVYAMQANEAGDDKRDELYDKAKLTLMKALSIDDELGEAHTSLAWIKRVHEWDWEGSEREFKRAIELNPNYYNAHMWYSFLLITLGRKDESLAEIEKARELAPLTFPVLANYATVRYFRQDNETLLPIAEQEKSLGARDYTVTALYSQIYLRLGEYQKVIDLINDFEERNNGRPYNSLMANLAAAYGLAGQMDKAEKIIRVLEANAKTSTEAGYRLSLAYADLGRNDEAIACLQRSVEARDDRLMWIKVEPRFDRLRDDPRFKEILQKMNLPA